MTEKDRERGYERGYEKSSSFNLIGVLGTVLVLLVGIMSFLLGYFVKECPEPEVKAIPLGGLVREVSKFAASEYYGTVEVTYSDVPDSLRPYLGSSVNEIVGIVSGEVAVGFDMEKMEDDYVWTDGNKKARVYLPPPEVLYVSVDEEHSRVMRPFLDLCPDIFCGDEMDVLLKKMIPEGKAELERQAQEAESLRRAAQHGKEFYTRFLYSLGFEEVEVIVIGYEDLE